MQTNFLKFLIECVLQIGFVKLFSLYLCLYVAFHYEFCDAKTAFKLLGHSFLVIKNTYFIILFYTLEYSKNQLSEGFGLSYYSEALNKYS